MTGMRELPKYQCVKMVWALRIASILINDDKSARIVPADAGYAPFTTDEGWASWFPTPAPEDLGYYIQYKDGSTSWSPSKAFEEGYRRI